MASAESPVLATSSSTKLPSPEMTDSPRIDAELALEVVAPLAQLLHATLELFDVFERSDRPRKRERRDVPRQLGAHEQLA